MVGALSLGICEGVDRDPEDFSSGVEILLSFNTERGDIEDVLLLIM